MLTERVVLSVEDDDAAYFFLEIAFAKLDGDFQLCRVSDGEEALSFLRRGGKYASAPRPDLILLDLNMPRLSGFDVLAAIRDDASLREIPAVVFSSSNEDSDRAKCFALGARSFIPKPYDFEEFIQAIKQAAQILMKGSSASA